MTGAERLRAIAQEEETVALALRAAADVLEAQAAKLAELEAKLQEHNIMLSLARDHVAAKAEAQALLRMVLQGWDVQADNDWMRRAKAFVEGLEPTPKPSVTPSTSPPSPEPDVWPGDLEWKEDPPSIT